MAETQTQEDQTAALRALGFDVEEEDQSSDTDGQSQADALKELGYDVEQETPDEATIPEPELDAISTQMYGGMSFEQAMERYNQIIESPDVTPPPLGVGYAIFKDPETGRREYIPRPKANMLDAAGKAITTAIQAPFSDEVSLSDAAAEFNNPDASVSAFDKIALGLGESFGGVAETVAAGAEKAGLEGAVDAVQPLVVNVDTGDSFTDAMLTDAVPAAAAAIATGGAANVAVKGYPLIIRALATAVPAEVAASLTTSTDEGTLFIGKDAALVSIADGVDFGDEKADQILEQRLNVLGEGLAITSGISGILPAGLKVTELAGKFALFPIYAAVVGGTTMERRVFERIANQLAQIDEAASPQQIMESRRAVAETIRANKDIIVPMLSKLDQDQKITVDTVSALLRGVDDPAKRTTAAGILQGQLQRGGKAPETTAAVERPQAVLQSEMDAALKEAGGETAEAQTATMGKAADILAGEARSYVEGGEAMVSGAMARFDNAAAKVVAGFKDDLEFGAKIEKLEDLVGTEIVKDQTTSFDQVREGLKKAYSTMTETKNNLYNAIPDGTEFDIEGFGKVLEQVTRGANDFDATGKQLLGNRLISTIRGAYGKTEPTVGQDAFGSIVEGAEALPIDQVIQEIADSGVDFKVLYNNVRPEISKLIDEAYAAGQKGVAQRLVTIKRAIDEQVEWIAENGGEEAAEVANAAKSFYQGTGDTVGYAQIWRDGGRMEEFGELYDPVVSRGVGESGFMEGSRDLVKDVLSGRNADAVTNMARALEQVQNPGPIADYMIADVINGFAGEVRSKGLSGASLAAFSDNLKQYAEALNQVFPERAQKVNQFIQSVNAAAGNKAALEQALQQATDMADEAKNLVRETELGGFLRGALGREFDTTTGPYKAFADIFSNAQDGVGQVRDLKSRLAELPQAQQVAVQDGMESAYLRLLTKKVQAAKMESGGTQSLKISSIDGMMGEADQMLAIGREIFSAKPEFMNGLTDLLEVSRMIGKGKGATPVAAMSPTAFNAEATKATNRLIMGFIGPLSRPGARLRAIAGGVFDAVDPTRKAEIILDNIFANPDKYLELSKKYDVDPMNPILRETLETGLITGFVKAYSADVSFLTDQENVDQQMMDLLPAE